jgi:EpsD family peptidyl-prolyl cis-trans isomerase
MPRLTLNLFALLALPVVLASCGVSQPGVSGQVLARVNRQDISVHQLNRMAGQAGELSQVQRDALLERLVQRELAVQQALSMKLDRQPEVMLRLEEARREALAAAWADHLAPGKPAPDENEAARYYAAHPGLFAERKLYRLEELALASGSPHLVEAESRLQNGEKFADIRAWLTGQGSRYTDRDILRLAEQLPLESVERLRQARPGQTVAFRSPQGLTVYQIRSAEALPVDWPTAAPVIKSHLATQARSLALESELKRLRAQAQITYAAGSGAS